MTSASRLAVGIVTMIWAFALMLVNALQLAQSRQYPNRPFLGYLQYAWQIEGTLVGAIQFTSSAIGRIGGAYEWQYAEPLGGILYRLIIVTIQIFVVYWCQQALDTAALVRGRPATRSGRTLSWFLIISIVVVWAVSVVLSLSTNDARWNSLIYGVGALSMCFLMLRQWLAMHRLVKTALQTMSQVSREATSVVPYQRRTRAGLLGMGVSVVALVFFFMATFTSDNAEIPSKEDFIEMEEDEARVPNTLVLFVILAFFTVMTAMFWVPWVWCGLNPTDENDTWLHAVRSNNKRGSHSAGTQQTAPPGNARGVSVVSGGASIRRSSAGGVVAASAVKHRTVSLSVNIGPTVVAMAKNNAGKNAVSAARLSSAQEGDCTDDETTAIANGSGLNSYIHPALISTTKSPSASMPAADFSPMARGSVKAAVFQSPSDNQEREREQEWAHDSLKDVREHHDDSEVIV